MINYNSSDVVQCLRQYDMFANSLRLIRNDEEKNMIIRQLNKLEEKIISLTNNEYLEEYNLLRDKKCSLLDEEKNRLRMLIDLINQRLSYVEKRCNSHYQLTGESIDVDAVPGADTLDNLEDRVRIIDKYTKNIKLESELKEDIKSLSNKISLAGEKMDINKTLNIELEASFKRVFDDAFNKLGLYDLEREREQIEYAFYETEKSLNLAKSNYEIAKTSPANILADCEEMLRSIIADYNKYKEEISILKLIELVKTDVSDYSSLLDKRKNVNELLKYIRLEDFLNLVDDTVNKQYNTIVMEEQDINTFNDLVLERERKTNALKEIQDENDSELFQNVLSELIENEKKKQAKLLEEQLRMQELEKKKKLEIERKKQEEILRRQKIIEEARKKEMEKRTKQMLEEQQNSVLQPRKNEAAVSFETIKDDVAKEKPEKEEISLPNMAEETTSDKEAIEQDLFMEFSSEKEIPSRVEKREEFFGSFDDKKPDNNKLPSMSIDEYMKSFDENSVDNTEDLFEDTTFPSIPM